MDPAPQRTGSASASTSVDVQKPALATSPTTLSAAAMPFLPKHHPVLGPIRERPAAHLVASGAYTASPSIAIPAQQSTKTSAAAAKSVEDAEEEEEEDLLDDVALAEADEEELGSSYGSSVGSSSLATSPIHRFAPSPLLNALYFPTSAPKGASTRLADIEYPCVQCDLVNKDVHLVLAHIKDVHGILIEKVEIIADLRRYLEYWRNRLKSTTLEKEHAAVPLPPDAGPADGAKTNVIGPRLPEDKRLREELQNARLTALIEKQQEERSDRLFSRKCLFCKKVCSGDRALLFSHMFNVHKFNIGLPDNLVNLNELLDILQAKISSLQCIYCEKTFKSYSVLKLHMRKKKHFKIDARNHEYDRFYLINYLESGKDWKQIQEEEDDEADPKDETWDEWVDPNEQETCVCLFCPLASVNPDASLKHTKEAHGFDLRQVLEDWALDEYDSIKVVNFIRRAIYEFRCPTCGLVHTNGTDLLAHMAKEKHFGVKKTDPTWRDAQYLFPTYENDTLLTGFADWSDDDEELSKRDQDKAMKDLGMDQLLDQP